MKTANKFLDNGIKSAAEIEVINLVKFINLRLEKRDFFFEIRNLNKWKQQTNFWLMELNE